MRINVTFKHTKKEIKLYKLINKQEEKSEFIKECIIYYLENNKEKE